MMKMNLDGINITIDYMHLYGKSGTPESTLCILTVNDKTFRGDATCSVTDHFDRSKGRRYALTRAVQKAMKRPQRKAFWTAFWDLRNAMTIKEIKVVTGKYVA